MHLMELKLSFVDAATGNDKNEGGCGAILCQADENGQLHVIAYASRSLSTSKQV